MSYAEMMTEDVQTCREERCFRMWINSLGISTRVNNLFEDVRNGYVLFHVPSPKIIVTQSSSYVYIQISFMFFICVDGYFSKF